MDKKYFIWTDCIGSLADSKKSINSFLKFHSAIHLNVFGFEDDIKKLPVSKNITYHKFSKISFFKYLNYKIIYRYKNSLTLDQLLIKRSSEKESKGISLFWAYILKKYINNSLIIHFDNKITFKSSAIFSLIEYSEEYDLIGIKKIIKDNNKFRNTIYSDGIDSKFFLIKPSLIPSISRLNQYYLSKLIQGEDKNDQKISFEFFDRICKELIANNGKIKFISNKQFDTFVSLKKNP